MASSVWAFSRHAIVPRRFPGYSAVAGVSRTRMDYPNYPVNIVSPSFIRADTAHTLLLLAVDRHLGAVRVQHYPPPGIDGFPRGSQPLICH